MASQPRRRRTAPRNPRQLPSVPSSWRCVHRKALACSRRAVAGREVPRQLRTQRRSDAAAGKSCRLSFIDWRGRDAACRSPLLPPLLPISNFIPHGATVVTSPVGVRRDDRCQRPELLRSAFRTRRGLQRTFVLLRCRRFPKAFETHDRESRVRMISVIVGSGRYIQTNRMSTTIHRAIRNNGKT